MAPYENWGFPKWKITSIPTRKEIEHVTALVWGESGIRALLEGRMGGRTITIWPDEATIEEEKRMTNSHEKPAECEGCNNPPKEFIYKMWLCENCIAAEVKARDEARISREKYESYRTPVDTTVSVRTDLFNAITESIANVKATIDADDTIDNKQYALAERLQAQINEYKKAIFELDEKKVTEYTKQRATQEYLNTLANTLRAEEREKLRMQDITYKPKPISKPIKTAKVPTARFSPREVRQRALEFGCEASTLQMIAVAKGSIEAAIAYLTELKNKKGN